VSPHHRHQEFLGFLLLIEGNVPEELEVHLVVDNYGNHRHAAIKGWLARHERFRPADGAIKNGQTPVNCLSRSVSQPRRRLLSNA
jgi:hypothetical protein